MTAEYDVRIDGETHRVRVAVPQRSGETDERLLRSARNFAISTAYLEHFGYLPRGVTNAEA